MRQLSRDFIVGLTALVGVAGLAALLLAFGEISLVSQPSYEVRLQLPDSTGIYANSALTLNGVRIGRVSSVRTDADPRRGVVLVLEINEGVRVPRDVRVGITQNFIGESTLSMTAQPRPDDAPPSDEDGFLQPGDTIERSASGMLDQIASLLDERFESIASAARSFERLSETYVRVGESIEDLVEPRTAADVDAGEEPNLASTVRRLDAAIADAREWLGDDGLREDARAATARARETMDRLADAVEAWRSAAETVSRNADRAGEGVDEAVAEFVRTTASLNETLGEIQFLAMRVNMGEGTLGMLIENPDLYRSLNDAAIRLEKALLETQLLVEKYRKEGVPIQF